MRVVQWTTGVIGTESLRAVLAHPAMELAGVWVSSEEKAGRDAGELAGLDKIGISATRDVEEILALKPDAVIYMPPTTSPDIPTLCRLLAGGANVVTTSGLFHYPAGLDPQISAAVESACAEGNSSVHSTGSSPGFITEAVPLTLTSMSRRVDRLTIEEFADVSRRDSPQMLFELMGFGSAPEAFDPARFEYGVEGFGPSLQLLGEALGIPLDSVRATGEVAVARQDTELAAGPLKAGTVGAQRMTVSGLRGGEAVLMFRPTWYVTADLICPGDQPWDLGSTGWRMQLEGDAPLEVEIRMPIPLERLAEVSPRYTANRAVNAVPYVVAAAPGIRTTADLPTITTDLSR
jgi:hypothetical protein